MPIKPAKLNCATIILLAICLLASGCATTSSQTAEYKPHKPQMITSDGAEEVGTHNLPAPLDHGFDLSESWANFLSAIRPALEILGGFAGR